MSNFSFFLSVFPVVTAINFLNLLPYPNLLCANSFNLADLIICIIIDQTEPMIYDTTTNYWCAKHRNFTV